MKYSRNNYHYSNKNSCRTFVFSIVLLNDPTTRVYRSSGVCEHCYDSIVTSISRSLSRSAAGTAALFKPISGWSISRRTKKCVNVRLPTRISPESFLVSAYYLIIANTHYIWLTSNKGCKNAKYFYIQNGTRNVILFALYITHLLIQNWYKNCWISWKIESLSDDISCASIIRQLLKNKKYLSCYIFSRYQAIQIAKRINFLFRHFHRKIMEYKMRNAWVIKTL